MIKTFSTAILLSLLVGVNMSFAQKAPVGIKIYSGYLHLPAPKSEGSLWHELFGPKKEVVVTDSECSIEFQGPVLFSNQSVDIIPQRLTYFIKFKNAPLYFGKFNIKVYSNDDDEYSIDPDTEGKQVDIKDGHHIYDQYLIYLILGSGINHIDVLSSTGDSKYVLDKFEIHDNH